MRDRFKFRVWDKENFNYLEFEGFKKGEIEFNFDIDTNTIWIEFDHNKYILEQCTGLKDKNGKLIYEGDVLKDVSARNSKYPNGVFYEVYWEEDSAEFCLYAINTDKYYPYKTWHLTRHDLDYEVIGNIYLDKDLFNEK